MKLKAQDMSFLVVFITAYLQRDHLNDTLSSWWFINMATYFALRCWEPAVDWRHPKITTWNVCMKNPIYKYREKWDKLWPGAGISSSMEKKAWSDAFSWSFAEDPIKNQKKMDLTVASLWKQPGLSYSQSSTAQPSLQPQIMHTENALLCTKAIFWALKTSGVFIRCQIWYSQKKTQQIRHFVLAEQTLGRVWKCRLDFHTDSART